MADFNRYVQHLFSDEDKSVLDRALLSGLSLGETLYSFGLNMWLSFYHTGHVHQHKLHAFTISVGNITAGGTGKTPFVQYLARHLGRRGEKVAVLSRGYRGAFEKKGGIVSDGKHLQMSAKQAGDEPYLLAKTLPGVVVAVGSNRSESGKKVEKLYEPTVVLLDDGFQHWALRRDIDIVLIDAQAPFSNGRMLPRGLLREPLENIERADIFVITKADNISHERLEEVKEVLHHFRERAPILVTAHRPGQMVPYAVWRNDGPPQAEVPQRVVTMCALGRPESFEATVRATGARVAGSIRLPDHHEYKAENIRRAMAFLRDEKADAIVVSEKDAVKINESMLTPEVPLYVLPMKMEMLEGEDAFWEYIYDEWEAGQ